jgi:Ran GTPase-activating protein (RanGAP) involved in mRNA processing and transport
MSRGLTKEEMYESLYVLNHVLSKMQKLGRIQLPHNKNKDKIDHVCPGLIEQGSRHGNHERIHSEI